LSDTAYYSACWTQCLWLFTQQDATEYEQKTDDSLGWKRSLGRQLNRWLETITGYNGPVTGRIAVMIMTNVDV
jgi:hypothetical protein